MMKKGVFLSVMLVAGVSTAQAGGYQIPEQGVKAMGMGNAFTAVADDASALWYNPAGLAFAKRGQVMAGGVVLAPNVQFTSNAAVATKPKNDLALVPHLYVSNIQENTGIAWGLGVNAPFGTKVDWPSTVPFATNALFSNLEMLMINPNIAFKISDHFAIAVGADLGWLKNVDFNTSILPQNFKGTGWGYNVAAMYKSDVVNVGLSYRSKIKVNATGTSRVIPTSSTSANAITVTTPDMFSAGLAFFPMDGLTISLNVDWVNWTKFDQLAFNYSTPLIVPTGIPVPPVVSISNITVRENWKATTAFRVGAEWEASEELRLRLGYAYDPTPVKDSEFTPLLPTNDIQTFSTGLGYDLTDEVSVDLAYMYVLFKDRQQTASTGSNASRNGLYETNIHIFASSVSYSF